MSKHIIEQEMIAREWVQKELIDRHKKLYNKDSSSMSSTFQIIYFGVDNIVQNSVVNTFKNENIFFLCGALTYLKLQNAGWFGDLADFGWDKSKKIIEEKFVALEKEEREIFLMETYPFFHRTRLYEDLNEIYNKIEEKVERVEGTNTIK